MVILQLRSSLRQRLAYHKLMERNQVLPVVVHRFGFIDSSLLVCLWLRCGLGLNLKVRWDSDSLLLENVSDSLLQRHLERGSIVGIRSVAQTLVQALGVFAQHNGIFETPLVLLARSGGRVDYHVGVQEYLVVFLWFGWGSRLFDGLTNLVV